MDANVHSLIKGDKTLGAGSFLVGATWLLTDLLSYRNFKLPKG